MLKVLNKRHRPHNDVEVSVYVGRPSVLGNPFEAGVDGTRDEVVQKYRQWLWTQFHKDPIVRNEIYRLVDLYLNHGSLGLECWCAPKNCHANQIKRLIEWLIAEEN